MANIQSAKKRAIQSEKNRQLNSSHRSRVRTFIKKVRAAIGTGKKAEAQEAFKQAQPVIDSMVNKHILSKNTAARYKSRLSKQIKNLSA